MHDFDITGDCMGLSTQIFGEEGTFVQSDMQFAQMAIADIRKLAGKGAIDRLDDEIAMELHMKLFQTEDITPDGRTVNLEATQLYVEYDSFLKKAREAAQQTVNGDLWLDRFNEERSEDIHPGKHGLWVPPERQGIFNTFESETLSLVHLAIDSVWFDDQDNVAGINFVNMRTFEYTIMGQTNLENQVA